MEEKIERSARHPLVEDFLLQYPGCDEDLADRAFLVYQDLTEVRGWWYTELAFNAHLDRPYVIGQRNRLTPRQAVLPFCVEEKMSLMDVRQYFSRIIVDEEPQNIIFLAVMDLDSTTVYYKLTSGLCPPDPPDIVARRKVEKEGKMERKRQHIAKCVREANERLAL